jgi:tRNA dimethylallyltransferase
MIKEVERLHSPPIYRRGGRVSGRGGISWKRLESFGLEYRFISLYLQKKLSYDEMFTKLLYAIKHYSKRQATWWKRNKEINWIKPDIKSATKLINHFLSSRI